MITRIIILYVLGLLLLFVTLGPEISGAASAEICGLFEAAHC